MTAQLTRQHYTIGLDARYDLRMAGESTSPEAVIAFQAAYAAAAARVASARGVDIDVVHVSYDAEADDYDTDQEAIDLWQDVHNRVLADEGRA